MRADHISAKFPDLVACTDVGHELAGIADRLGNALDKRGVAPSGRALDDDVVAQDAGQSQCVVDDVDVVFLRGCGVLVNFVGHVVVSSVGVSKQYMGHQALYCKSLMQFICTGGDIL